MANITLALPDELRERMKQMKYIRWSEVAREAIESRMNDIELADELVKHSAFTEKDAEKIGALIKKRMAQRLEYAYNSRHKHNNGCSDTGLNNKKNNS